MQTININDKTHRRLLKRKAEADKAGTGMVIWKFADKAINDAMDKTEKKHD